MSELFLQVAFVALAALTCGCAFAVVAFRNLLHAAVALFFCLTGVAGLYVLLGADFVGVTQLLAYAGGVLVLIIFGVFMTARIYNAKVDFGSGKGSVGIALVVAGGLFSVVASMISKTPWPTRVPTYGPTAQTLGDLFLTKYLLPFEIISLLLLFALVGAVLLVRKEVGES